MGWAHFLMLHALPAKPRRMSIQNCFPLETGYRAQVQTGRNELPQLLVDFLIAYNTQEALRKAALREEDRDIVF